MNAVLITTDLRKDRRWHSRPLERGLLDAVHQVSVYPGCRYQRFEGFGGAFTEAAAHSWAQLPEEPESVFGLLFWAGGVGLQPGACSHRELRFFPG